MKDNIFNFNTSDEIHIISVVHWQDNLETISLYIDGELVIHGDNETNSIERTLTLINSLVWINDNNKWVRSFSLKIDIYTCPSGTDLSKRIIFDKNQIDNKFHNILIYLDKH